MKRFIIFQLIVLLLTTTAIAQESKVAVFDPVGNTDVSIKEIVREEISSIIVNIGGFTVLERQLIEKVLAENKFQQSGLVDDSQISEIGRLMGANSVFVTSLTEIDKNYFISCKMIDVQTARIEKQKTAQTYNGTSDLVNTVRLMMGAMFDKKIASAPTFTQKNTTSNTTTQKNTTTTQTQTQTQTTPQTKPSPQTNYTPAESGSHMTFSDFKAQLRFKKKDMFVGNYSALSSYKKRNAEVAAGSVLLCVGVAGIITGPCLGFNKTKREPGHWQSYEYEVDCPIYWEDEDYCPWDEWCYGYYPTHWVTWQYWADGNSTKKLNTAAVAITAVGGAAFITGVGLLIASALELKTTYSLYTRGGKTACTFDFHPLVSPQYQGFGMTLKF